MSSFDSNKAKRVISEQLNNLYEYVCSSQIMDERTYHAFFEGKETPMSFIMHQPLDGGFDIYRTRLADTFHLEEDLTTSKTFSYIPLEKCTDNFPKLQRCNFSGQSIFYASMSLNTNFQEIDPDCCAGKTVYLTKWHVDENSKVNLFRVIPPEGIDCIEDYHGLLKIDQGRNYPQELINYLRIIGEIMMKADGSVLEKYLPSALLCNFIYNFKYDKTPIFEGQDFVYHGILYPSVKHKDRSSLNIALTPNFVDKHVRLKYVIKGTVNEDLNSINFQEIGFCHEPKIIWYQLKVNRDTIKPTEYYFLDKDGLVYNVSKGHLYDLNHKEVKNYYSVFFADIDIWMENKLLQLPDRLGDLSLIKNESSLCFTINDWYVARELEGWTLELEDKTIQISRVEYKFEYQTNLEEL